MIMETKEKQMTENEQELIPYSKLEREEDILELLCQWENQQNIVRPCRRLKKRLYS